MPRPYILSIIAFLLCISCSNPRHARYFVDHKDSVYPIEEVEKAFLIQKADILGITVSSLNPEADVIFNAPMDTRNYLTNMAGGMQTPFGFLVNKDGMISYPVLGNILAEGLSKDALTDTIKNMLERRQLLKDPNVSVRILNYRVTILGEVGRPSVVNVANEKVSILEALGMAGDILVTANRENVLLIREEGGKRITKRLNLNSDEIFTSPYYYLRNNDVVYVEANDARIRNTSRFTTLFPTVIGALTVLVVILQTILLNN